MGIHTILLNATNEQCMGNLLEVVGMLAARAHIHVIGLAILPMPIVFPAGTPGHPHLVTVAEQRDALIRAADIMRVRFEQAAKLFGFSQEWRLEDATRTTPASIVLSAARTADVAIAAQSDSSWNKFAPTSIIDRLMLEAGRPVLLVPKYLTSPSSIERILIAWNGSQHASRAVADALPLLRQARHVKLLHFTQAGEYETEELGSVARLADSLMRHDVVAVAEELGLRGTDAGPAILSAVKAENADMLIMGCYGHSRFRELVLGGATRHVLEHMTVPVFMSH